MNKTICNATNAKLNCLSKIKNKLVTEHFKNHQYQSRKDTCQSKFEFFSFENLIASSFQIEWHSSEILPLTLLHPTPPMLALDRSEVYLSTI